ncbi:MAG: LL-diaminopimelate aminotransferase [bacterium]|nr:LL-diaminopimelate aminotransferase [bacterium]
MAHLEIARAERLAALPPYLFAEIDRMAEEERARGADIIDLGVGDPDLPTPAHIVEALKEASGKPANHRYPSYLGMIEFRRAVADWYKDRFGVELEPEREVVSLIGSKEGIAHLPLAFVNPSDVVLYSDPGYPVYRTSVLFAGGVPEPVSLRAERGFLPALEEIPADLARRAKLFYVNYPNNPTSACCERSFFEELVAWAVEHQVAIAHDAAYTEMSYDGFRPPSILEVEGAKEVAIEFHSLSKTYNMTGWRVGFAVGSAQLVGGLGGIKTNIDSGIFQAVQEAGIAALSGPQECVAEMRRIYQGRRDVVVEGLREAGLEVASPRATFYVWFACPQGMASTDCAAHLLRKTGIVLTPGVGFGAAGEGYCRIALTVGEERLAEAVGRIKEVGF